MAKKKTGNDASKKTLQKKKEKIIEDKTFGLKNKNKSKKVQQHIESVQKNVLNSGDPKVRKQEEQRQKVKAEAKARKKAAKDEQDALFNEALMAVSKKTSTSTKDGKVEAIGRDGDDENTTKKGTSRAMKMMYQMDAQEMSAKLREDPNYVPTLEDAIEEQRTKLRAELQAQGKTGTPVTPETFAEWQEKKRKLRAEAMKKKVEAEFKKKKGGKGLSVLSGRDLYEYKRDLFNDKDNDEDEGTNSMSVQSSNIMDATTSDNNSNLISNNPKKEVEKVAEKVQSDLFLEGTDNDLDDLDDMDD